MSDMSRSNLVVEEINNTPWIQFVVWTVNAMQGTLHETVVFVGIVRDVDVGVLEPGGVGWVIVV